MNKYLSILRGINVSGQKKIKMDELRTLYESLDFFDVSSYIQSGNLIFCTKEKNPEEIKKSIENKIEEKFNFFVHVQIVSETDLEKIIIQNPFRGREIDLQKLYVVFLDRSPEKSSIKIIQDLINNNEEFINIKKVIYLYCPTGYGRTKLNNNFFEKKLKVNATTRNWRTTNKLYEILKEKNCGSTSV